MRNLLRLIAGAFAMLMLAAAPAISASTPTQYATALTAIYGSAAPYTGSLKLTISDAGIVHGYYFSSDGSAMYVPVTGGKTGESIWFDIGNNGMYHVEARLRDGKIVGSALGADNDQYTFVADPAR